MSLQFRGKKQFQPVTVTEKQFQVGTGTVFQLRLPFQPGTGTVFQLQVTFQVGTETEKQLRFTFQLGTGTEKQFQNSYDSYVTVFRNCNDPPCPKRFISSRI